MRVLKIWVRLLLLAAALIGPVFMLAAMLAHEQSDAIEFASAERRGVEYQSAAWDVMKGMTAHRTLGAMVVAGNKASLDPLLQSQRDVDASLARLITVDQTLGAEMHTTELLNSLKSEWEAMKSRSSQPGDLQAYLIAHNRLVYDMGRVIIKMGNHSNLILDPDIDTYYLMDATQFKLSRLLDQVTQIQAIGAAALARPAVDGVEGISPLERAQIATASTRADEYLREGVTNLEYAFDANGDLRSSLGGSVQVLQSSVGDMLADANRRFATPSSGGAEAWLASTDKAITADAAMYDNALANLDKGLAARIAAKNSRRTLTMVSVAVVALLTIAATLVVVQSIVSPIGALQSTAMKISLGELTAKIDASGTDEVSELAKAFGRMQESLKIAARDAGEI